MCGGTGTDYCSTGMLCCTGAKSITAAVYELFQKLSYTPPPFLCTPASRAFGVGRLPPVMGTIPITGDT